VFFDPANGELACCGDGFCVVGVEPTEVLVTEGAVGRVELNLLGQLQVVISRDLLTPIRILGLRSRW